MELDLRLLLKGFFLEGEGVSWSLSTDRKNVDVTESECVEFYFSPFLNALVCTSCRLCVCKTDVLGQQTSRTCNGWLRL